MNLQKEAVNLVDNIDKKLGIVHDTDTTVIHLLEEFGEIARQVYNEKSKRDPFDKENLKEEIADVIIILSKLAQNYNIDIEEAVINKIKKTKKRYNLT